MKTIQEMIEVMNAFSEGQEIEFYDYDLPQHSWKTTKTPSWCWGDYDYRIKKRTQLLFWAVLRKNNGAYITTNPKPFSEFQGVLLGYERTATVIETYQKEFEVN